MVTCHLAPALPKHHIHYTMHVPGPWWGGRCCPGQITGKVLNGVTGSWTCHRFLSRKCLTLLCLFCSHPTFRLDTKDVFEGWLLWTNMF